MGIGKKFVKYVSQNIFGMLGISCYVVADTFFISKYAGADGITVLNLVLPVFSVIFAFGSMMGVGSAIRFKILRARGDAHADDYFSNSIMCACILSILFILVGIFAPDKLLHIMGADDKITAIGIGYTRTFLMFTPFFMCNYIVSAYVRNDNDPSRAMLATLSGSLFNIVFDYIFMFPIEYVEYFGRVYNIYFKHNLKKTLKNTDMILYNSEQTKRTTEKFFPEAKDIDNVNAYIISNPVRKKWISTDENYFLYIGNMEKRKGVDLLINGYLKYKELGGKKKLILGGKMQEDDINTLVHDAMEKDKDITYLDYVAHNKKLELYAGMSAFVFPSKAEGFGMPIIEVMRFNKPIIASNLPIFDEITDGNINTFDLYCSADEQIKNLAQIMLNYNANVDESAYEAVVNRYLPERLGKIVYDFVNRYRNNN